jgi:tRNA-dihydrouridine synthase
MSTSNQDFISHQHHSGKTSPGEATEASFNLDHQTCSNRLDLLALVKKQAAVGLAPMDGVTDQPFRHIVQKYGQPDLIFTEFVNVAGLCHGARGLLRPLLYDDSQQPIIAQIFGTRPQYFRQVAVLVAELGFAGVDINMGCPARQVTNHGAGAGLIKQPRLAQEIIQAVQQGIADWHNGRRCQQCPDLNADICQWVQQQAKQQSLGQASISKQKQVKIAVSVKTRLGYDQPQVKDWISTLLAAEPDMISLHGRTVRQGYKGQADWAAIAQAAQLAHQHKVPLLGNGDVQSRTEAQNKIRKYQVDGVLIGRAVQGNPFVFAQPNPLSSLSAQERAQRLAQVALEHARLYEQTFAQQQPFAAKYHFLPMRKHLAWYVKGIAHAKQIRQQLVRANNSQEVEQILQQWDLVK